MNITTETHFSKARYREKQKYLSMMIKKELCKLKLPSSS